MPALELRDICVKTSGGIDIVTDVSLAVSTGQIMGLVGESGSGKSTTALAALGHSRRGVHITSGEARILDEDLLTLSRAQLRERRGKTVSFVPQNPPDTLNPAMRIGDHLTEMAAHLAGESDSQTWIADALENVRLPQDKPFLRRYPHQLSGGQQQRVVLALAFLCRPSVVILDEPTTGLDVTTQRHILMTIRRLCERFGTASLYVSHDLAVISQLADDVSVMYAGRIVEQSSSTRLFRAPAHPYSRALIAAVPDVHRRVEARGIPGAAPPPGRRPSGCAFWPRCQFAIDVCKEQPPSPTRVHEDQAARCYRAEHVSMLGAPLATEPIAFRASMPKATETALEVADLHARHGEREVLEGVAFALKTGASLAIVGESGSGKTTLARCIVGLHHQATGEIRLRAQTVSLDTRRRTKRQRQDIQLIFQNPHSSLNPRRTVDELLRRPLELFLGMARSEARARVAELLEQVSLSESLRNRLPHELSGGEQQRVAIARALAAEPAILVCDEVTSSLDVSVQASVIELLRRLRSELGLTMVFITHNLALVPLVSDTVVVMKDGQVIESGDSNSVLEHPRHEYTIELLDSSVAIPFEDMASRSILDEEV